MSDECVDCFQIKYVQSKIGALQKIVNAIKHSLEFIYG